MTDDENDSEVGGEVSEDEDQQVISTIKSSSVDSTEDISTVLSRLGSFEDYDHYNDFLEKVKSAPLEKEFTLDIKKFQETLENEPRKTNCTITWNATADGYIYESSNHVPKLTPHHQRIVKAYNLAVHSQTPISEKIQATRVYRKYMAELKDLQISSHCAFKITFPHASKVKSKKQSGEQQDQKYLEQMPDGGWQDSLAEVISIVFEVGAWFCKTKEQGRCLVIMGRRDLVDLAVLAFLAQSKVLKHLSSTGQRVGWVAAMKAGLDENKKNSDSATQALSQAQDILMQMEDDRKFVRWVSKAKTDKQEFGRGYRKGAAYVGNDTEHVLKSK